MKNLVTQQVKEMSVDFRSDSLSPKEQVDMKFMNHETELTRECQQFGKVCTHSVCPNKCHATDPGTQVAMVGELATATFHARDKERKKWAEPVEVSCELVPSDRGGLVRGEVEGKGEGKYEISYILPIAQRMPPATHPSGGHGHLREPLHCSCAHYYSNELHYRPM